MNDKSMKQATIDFLSSAKELIEEHGWVQKFLGDRKSGFCVLGAIDQVRIDLTAKNVKGPADGYFDRADVINYGNVRAVDALSSQVPDRQIVTWNDAEGRVQGDVVKLLDRTIESLRTAS